MRLHHEAKIMSCAWVSQTQIGAFYMSSWSFLSDSDCVTFHQLGKNTKKPQSYSTWFILLISLGKKQQGEEKAVSY